jgi:hypothetical protein
MNHFGRFSFKVARKFYKGKETPQKVFWAFKNAGFSAEFKSIEKALKWLSPKSQMPKNLTIKKKRGKTSIILSLFSMAVEVHFFATFSTRLNYSKRKKFHRLLKPLLNKKKRQNC